MKPAIVKETVTVTRWRGLNKAARELGVTKGHLSYIMRGKRPAGRRLAARLKEMGVVVQTRGEGGRQ